MQTADRTVFVDPDDDALPYWWPALIVPESEYDVFCETMDSDVSRIRKDEALVCYFEDGSFSVVPRSALIPFHPEKEPFLSYAHTVRRFMQDESVRRATAYWRDGSIPFNFKWLRLVELGYCEKSPATTAAAGEKKKLDGSPVDEQQQPPMTMDDIPRRRKKNQNHFLKKNDIASEMQVYSRKRFSVLGCLIPQSPMEQLRLWLIENERKQPAHDHSV